MRKQGWVDDHECSNLISLKLDGKGLRLEMTKDYLSGLNIDESCFETEGRSW